MELPSRDGIMCDVCGMSCRDDFIYYSYDFRPVEVYGNRKPSLDEIFGCTITFSLDVCPVCFDKHKKSLIANYNKILAPQRRVVVGTFCDLSGHLMAGTYNFYHISVTKVSVRATPKPARLSTDERHVEINVTEDMYKMLTEAAGTVRKVAGQWSTNSNIGPITKDKK